MNMQQKGLYIYEIEPQNVLLCNFDSPKDETVHVVIISRAATDMCSITNLIGSEAMN